MYWVIDMFYFIREWWFLIISFMGVLYSGYKGIKTLNTSLIEIKNELKLSNQRYESSEIDRLKIWEQLFKNDTRLDHHEITLARHEIYLETLKGGE